jgi:hypothetical protein
MSISSINGDLRADCPVYGPEDRECFPMEMEEFFLLFGSPVDL